MDARTRLFITNISRVLLIGRCGRQRKGVFRVSSLCTLETELWRADCTVEAPSLSPRRPPCRCRRQCPWRDTMCGDDTIARVAQKPRMREPTHLKRLCRSPDSLLRLSSVSFPVGNERGWYVASTCAFWYARYMFLLLAIVRAKGYAEPTFYIPIYESESATVQ